MPLAYDEVLLALVEAADWAGAGAGEDVIANARERRQHILSGTGERTD